MRVGVQHLATVVLEAATIHQGEHGLPQRLSTRDFRIASLAAKQVADKFAGGSRMHLPVGD